MNQNNQVSRRPIAKEKEMVNLVRKLQDKVEDLSGIFGGESHMNSFAFKELSDTNLQLAESLKCLFTNIADITTTMTESRWYMSETGDPRYHKRQYKKIEQKIQCKEYIRCDCGEVIHKNFFTDHKKRTKHINGIMKIRYETKNFKVYKMVSLQTCQVVNCLVNSQVNHKKESIGYKYFCLEELVRKYKANKRRLEEAQHYREEMAYQLSDEGLALGGY